VYRTFPNCADSDFGIVNSEMLVNGRILFLKPALCTEGTGVIQEHQE